MKLSWLENPRQIVLSEVKRPYSTSTQLPKQILNHKDSSSRPHP